LDVSPSASFAEVGRAYRKKSVALHPDKNPGVKGAPERFARLGVIAQILRNREGRERYDFFYKNGVPKWRGTGYYYQRYRPGLGSVMIFLIVVTSGLQFVIQRLNYKRDLERIERFVREARLAAWGPKMVPVEGKRKVKVNLGGRVYVDEDGNPVPGKYIDMVVEGGDVFILEPDGELLPLDEGVASPPSLRRTWFVALAEAAYHKARGKATGYGEESLSPVLPAESGNGNGHGLRNGSAIDDDDSSSSDTPSSGAVTPSNDLAKGRATATVKAGGRRRQVKARKTR